MDKGFAESRVAIAGAQVVEDYGYLGNQVDIGNNNNKFFRGQVLQAGGSFFSWTRWGRVGEPGQNKLDGPMGKAEAIAAFKKKFKDKTTHQWQGNSASYPGGKSGKYSVIFEAFDTSQSAKLAASGVGGGRQKKKRWSSLRPRSRGSWQTL